VTLSQGAFGSTVVGLEMKTTVDPEFLDQLLKTIITSVAGKTIATIVNFATLGYARDVLVFMVGRLVKNSVVGGVFGEALHEFVRNSKGIEISLLQGAVNSANNRVSFTATASICMPGGTDKMHPCLPVVGPLGAANDALDCASAAYELITNNEASILPLHLLVDIMPVTTFSLEAGGVRQHIGTLDKRFLRMHPILPTAFKEQRPDLIPPEPRFAVETWIQNCNTQSKGTNHQGVFPRNGVAMGWGVGVNNNISDKQFLSMALYRGTTAVQIVTTVTSKFEWVWKTCGQTYTGSGATSNTLGSQPTAIVCLPLQQQLFRYGAGAANLGQREYSMFTVHSVVKKSRTPDDNMLDMSAGVDLLASEKTAPQDRIDAIKVVADELVQVAGNTQNGPGFDAFAVAYAKVKKAVDAMETRHSASKGMVIPGPDETTSALKSAVTATVSKVVQAVVGPNPFVDADLEQTVLTRFDAQLLARLGPLVFANSVDAFGEASGDMSGVYSVLAALQDLRLTPNEKVVWLNYVKHACMPIIAFEMYEDAALDVAADTVVPVSLDDPTANERATFDVLVGAMG